MSAILTILHVLVCLVLVLAVLLQSGKAADLAGAFGGGGSQTAFGARGTASLMSKITTIGAILFMISSFALWILSDKGARSVVKSVEPGKPAAAAAAESKKETTKPPATTPQKTEDKKPAQQPSTQQTPQKKDAGASSQEKKS